MLLAALLAATNAPRAGAQSERTQPPTARERCLIDALDSASPDTSVASIRERCAEHRTPASTVTIPATPSPASAAPALSATEARYAAESRLWTDRLAFLPHRPNYLLPIGIGRGFRGGSDGGTLQSNEVLFQISLKLPVTVLGDGDTPSVFFAYTGRSWWQAYNANRSSPFREYNHEPEIFFTTRQDSALGGWKIRARQVGFSHQSNGRSGAGSRSWNRLFVQWDADRGASRWSSLRLWARVPERSKSNAGDASGDDNPDIRRYLGDGEWRLGRRYGDWQWGLMLRRSLQRGGKGAAELTISHATGFNPKARWFALLFDGYGESLIDYDRRVARIGFGIQLNDWY